MNYRYFLQRLKEPSTWNGIAVAVGAAGFAMPDDWGKAGVAIATMMLTVINIFWKKDSQAE